MWVPSDNQNIAMEHFPCSTMFLPAINLHCWSPAGHVWWHRRVNTLKSMLISWFYVLFLYYPGGKSCVPRISRWYSHSTTIFCCSNPPYDHPWHITCRTYPVAELPAQLSGAPALKPGSVRDANQHRAHKTWWFKWRYYGNRSGYNETCMEY